MKAQLTSLGGNVTTFESGDAFLRHRRTGFVWDLIVVSAPRSRCLFGRSVASEYAVWQADYLMPRLNGVETIGQLGGDVLAQTNVYLVSGIDALKPGDQITLDRLGLPLIAKSTLAMEQIWSSYDSTKKDALSPAAAEAEAEGTADRPVSANAPSCVPMAQTDESCSEAMMEFTLARNTLHTLISDKRRLSSRMSELVLDTADACTLSAAAKTVLRDALKNPSAARTHRLDHEQV
jgi:hypothetical protein